MKVSVILGHPNPQSFNHAIAREVVQALQSNRHAVTFHDLYQEKFDPVLEFPEIAKDALLGPIVRRHCDEIAAADGIVIVHPDWWGQPPAILKGWIDRVIRPGVAYKFEEVDKGIGKSVGILRASAALVFNTSNTPREVELRVFGDPLETLWKTCIFATCGVSDFYRKMYGPIVISTPEQRKAWLEDIQEAVRAYFPRES